MGDARMSDQGARAAPRVVPMIDRYRQIESFAREMLEAGRAGDWVRVGDLEATIRRLADGIEQAGGPAGLAPHEQRDRIQILQRLVRLDGTLRRLADPQNRWLDAMFDAGRGSRTGPRGAEPGCA